MSAKAPSTPPVEKAKPRWATVDEALLEAKKELEPIKKEKEGQVGKRKFSYAPLELILEVEKVLAQHGLVVTQPTFIDRELRMLCVRTTLTHPESGVALISEYPAGDLARRTLTGVSDDGVVWTREQEPSQHHQDLGLCVTYARRNSLLALLGIAPEEEDNDSDAQRQRQPQSAPRPGYRSAPAQPAKELELAIRITKFITDTQTGLLRCESTVMLDDYWEALTEKLVFLEKTDLAAYNRLVAFKENRLRALSDDEDRIPE